MNNNYIHDVSIKRIIHLAYNIYNKIKGMRILNNETNKHFDQYEKRFISFITAIIYNNHKNIYSDNGIIVDDIYVYLCAHYIDRYEKKVQATCFST